MLYYQNLAELEVYMMLLLLTTTPPPKKLQLILLSRELTGEGLLILTIQRTEFFELLTFKNQALIGVQGMTGVTEVDTNLVMTVLKIVTICRASPSIRVSSSHTSTPRPAVASGLGAVRPESRGCGSWEVFSHSTKQEGTWAELWSRAWESLLWKVKVAQLCTTLCDPMDYTVHGILQTRILEWVAFPFSRGSSQPRDRTQVSCIAGGFFTS